MTKIENRVLGQRTRANILMFLGERDVPASRESIMLAVGFSGRQSSGVGRNIVVMQRRGYVKADENMNYSLTLKGVKAYEKLKREVQL